MAAKTIAVDFDGTLAQYHGWGGIGEYGAPVPSMVELVNHWIMQGHEVVIFTARLAPVDEDGGYVNTDDQKVEARLIRKWLAQAGVMNADRLEITCIKHRRFNEIWDDRAVSVERNTGRFTSLTPNLSIV